MYLYHQLSSKLDHSELQGLWKYLVSSSELFLPLVYLSHLNRLNSRVFDIFLEKCFFFPHSNKVAADCFSFFFLFL